jgi:hypothetical protein
MVPTLAYAEAVTRLVLVCPDGKQALSIAVRCFVRAHRFME